MGCMRYWTDRPFSEIQHDQSVVISQPCKLQMCSKSREQAEVQRTPRRYVL